LRRVPVVDSAADVLHRLEQLRDGDGRMRS